MTTTYFSVEALQQGAVIGTDGATIGKVGQVYLDDRTGRPSWVTITTGWFGTRESFVPLDAAVATGEDITVPYDKEKIGLGTDTVTEQHAVTENVRKAQIELDGGTSTPTGPSRHTRN